MPSKNKNIQEFNQYMKSDKILCIIHNDLEFLIKKIDGSGDNPEKSSASKIGENVPCGYSMATVWAFDNIENKHSLYRGRDCMKKFCACYKLMLHATN